MTENETIFQKIISGEIPCTKIYEDEHTLAFLDIQPNNPGHKLVVPKNHSKNIFDIPEEDFKNVAATVRKIAPAVKSGTGADGIFLAMNNEIGQDVFHSHVHIIPRFKDDGWFIGRHLSYKEGEMEEVAANIRAAISAR